MALILTAQSATSVSFQVSGVEPAPVDGDLLQINVSYSVGASTTILAPIPASAPAGGMAFAADYAISRPSGATGIDVYLESQDTHGNKTPFTPVSRRLDFDLTGPGAGTW